MANDSQPQFIPSLLGEIELVTAPTATPIDINWARDHCVVTHSEDDVLLLRKIQAATEYCQRESGRQYMTTTFNLPVRGWWSGRLKLPRPPLQSVVTVKYFVEGVLTTLSSASYAVRTPINGAGWIEWLPDYSWPSTDDREFPIIIQLIAGYTSAALVPYTAREAISQMVDYLYTTNRGDKDIDIPNSIASLLNADGYGSYA